MGVLRTSRKGDMGCRISGVAGATSTSTRQACDQIGLRGVRAHDGFGKNVHFMFDAAGQKFAVIDPGGLVHGHAGGSVHGRDVGQGSRGSSWV